MARTVTPAIEQRSRTRGATNATYFAHNGVYSDPGYKTVDLDVRRTPDGNLRIELYRFDPGTVVVIGDRVFTVAETDLSGRAVVLTETTR